ncbi:MAG: hypothetical protein JXK07_08840 [Spirochaetes bacterium]|nr:hypothetical protein [Spirochaetota bacterium]
MKKKLLLITIIFAVATPLAISAQSSVKGVSINGSTGVIVSPTARVGWEYSNLGIDFGYSFLYGNGMGHVPTVTLSFAKKAELGAALNIRDNGRFDLLYHGKFQFYRNGGSAVAMGIKGDVADLGGNGGFYMTPYIVATYSGNFFTWPAVTSMMFGWNMIENGAISPSFAFSMGFELSLFPEVFKNYVYWISDFSNYSYASTSSIAEDRGTFNTGIRIDPVKKGKFKLVFDFVGTDLLDSSRGFMASGAFGVGF